MLTSSSVAATLGTAFNQHYAATKAGLIAITRAVAVEFARYGITANALLPSYTKTEMIDDLLEKGLVERAYTCIECHHPFGPDWSVLGDQPCPGCGVEITSQRLRRQ